MSSITNTNTINNITKTKQKKLSTKKVLQCSNCGKIGHLFKNCPDPITSYGIINVNFSNITDDDITNVLTKIHTINNNTPEINIPEYKNLESFMNNQYNLSFLLIRRKHTLGFMEFVRGHYKIDNIEGIIYLFKQMIEYEIELIGKKDFDLIWEYTWGINSKNREYEYNLSKDKFTKLIEGFDEILDLDFYVSNVKPKFTSPEWGFPKGRRNFGESDLECGLREFQEETSIDINNITIIDIEPFEEKFTGTNGILYRHVYFLSYTKDFNKIDLDKTNKSQKEEIGDIGFYNFYDSIDMIRPYHTERMRLITKIYINIIKIIMNNKLNKE